MRLGRNGSEDIGHWVQFIEVLPRSGERNVLFFRPNSAQHCLTREWPRRCVGVPASQNANSGTAATDSPTRPRPTTTAGERSETGYPESWAGRKLAHREKDRPCDQQNRADEPQLSALVTKESTTFPPPSPPSVPSLSPHECRGPGWGKSLREGN